MPKSLFRPLLFLLLILVLPGCGNPPATPATTASEVPVEDTSTPLAPSATLEATFTPDPCSRPQLETEVQKVHKHMREFDDASALASSVPREQLSAPIGDLQRIRREAEDEQIPVCLSDLKAIQIRHMNTVIETLLTFMRGTDQQTLEQGITLARQQHDQYTLELARLLGATIVVATPPPAPSATPTP